MVVNCIKLSGKMGWGPDEADQRVVTPGVGGGVGRRSWLGLEGGMKQSLNLSDDESGKENQSMRARILKALG